MNQQLPPTNKPAGCILVHEGISMHVPETVSSPSFSQPFERMAIATIISDILGTLSV
jgi:hypothetical protein